MRVIRGYRSRVAHITRRGWCCWIATGFFQEKRMRGGNAGGYGVQLKGYILGIDVFQVLSECKYVLL